MGWGATSSSQSDRRGAAVSTGDLTHVTWSWQWIEAKCENDELVTAEREIERMILGEKY
jgi:hypothetical protein